MTSGDLSREQAWAIQKAQRLAKKPEEMGCPGAGLACGATKAYDPSEPPTCFPMCELCLDKWLAFEGLLP